MTQIKPTKIKDVVSKGGETINSIIDETSVKIDIDQDNNVSIVSSDAEMIKKAIRIIEELTKKVEIGQIYLVKVARIEKFGVFANLTKGKDGLIHISQSAGGRANNVKDVAKLGDEVLIKVTEIDKQGCVSVSKRALLNEGNKKK